MTILTMNVRKTNEPIFLDCANKEKGAKAIYTVVEIKTRAKKCSSFRTNHFKIIMPFVFPQFLVELVRHIE